MERTPAASGTFPSDPSLDAYNREQELLPRLKALSENARSMRRRMEDLEAIATLYARSIENGVYPGKGSPCHQKIKELIGEIGTEQEKTA